MRAIAIAGLLLVLLAVPIANFGIVEYSQYLAAQRQAEKEAVECANTVCGGGMMSLEAKDHFDASMRYLVEVMFAGAIGMVLLGLNMRDLAKPLESY